MKKLSIISGMLSKISHKKFELYVISRIIHKLDDPEIEYVFQQYATRDDQSGEYALIDLYLPQFDFAIEVDEPCHLKRMTEDQMRMKEIPEYYSISHIERVDCSQTIAAVNAKIDDIVNKINIIKARLIADGKYKPWDGLSGYDHYMNTGLLIINDHTKLSSPTEICRCFGLDNAGRQGSRTWTDPRDSRKYKLWWPKENYEDSDGHVSGRWYNKMEEDEEGTWIIEADMTSVQASEEHVKAARRERSRYPRRIVFFAKKNWTGDRVYDFWGVYELVDNVGKINIEGEKYDACIWKRVDDRFELPKLSI